MAFKTTKLSEVELVTSTVDPKLLIEDMGEIKRVSPETVAPSQVQADWNETDTSSPAYILNKPTTGGSVDVVTYCFSGSLLWDVSTSSSVTKNDFVEKWNKGTVIRLKASSTTPSSGTILGVTYTLSGSNVNTLSISYVTDASTTISTMAL